jgi:excisionase family DNA binding protein
MAATATDSQFLTAVDAAARLRVSPETISAARRKGQLAAVGPRKRPDGKWGWAYPARVVDRLAPGLSGPPLKTTEVAARLGLSARAVRNYARSGRLPAFQVTTRGSWRYDKKDVEAFAARKASE